MTNTTSTPTAAYREHTLNRVPLAWRGIRCVEGEDSAAPATTTETSQAKADSSQQGASQPAQASSGMNPADVAAMLQNLGKATPPAPKPGTSFTPEDIQRMVADLQAAKTQTEQLQKQLADAEAAKAELDARIKQQAFETAISTAASGKADPAMLLDSKAFTAALADVDTSKSEDVATALDAFLEKHPAYRLQAGIAKTSGGTPTGKTPDQKPTSLQAAIAQHYSNL